MLEHNKKLLQFIADAHADIDQSSDASELVSIVEHSREFEGNFAFNNKDYYQYMGIAAGLFALSLLLFYFTNSGIWLLAMAIFVAVPFFLFSKIKTRNHLITELTNKIFYKDLFFDNNIAPSDNPNFAINPLKERFNDFHRGNYSQEIRDLLEGEHHNEDAPFTYHFVNLHYVDQEKIVTTNSDGKKETKIVYHHFDRYGIILPIEEIENVKITHYKKTFGFNKSDYEPSSMEFRKQFIVKAAKEFHAARFLTPSIVELLLSIPGNLDQLILEFNDHGELLISFTNKNIIAAQRQYDFTKPEQFLEEIKVVNKLPKLQYILNTTQKLVASTQNNFS